MKKLIKFLLSFIFVFGIMLFVIVFNGRLRAEEISISELKVYKTIHTIKSGDTLERIARRYILNIEDIEEENDISRDDVLHIGDKIFIPEIKLNPEVGEASWYGDDFDGRLMANGKIFDKDDPTTIAHPFWPLGTIAKAINLENGRSVIVVVRDRGSFREKYGRVIDCSEMVAVRLDFREAGTVQVKVIPLTTT